MSDTFKKAIAWSMLLHVLVMTMLWLTYGAAPLPQPLLLKSQPVAAYVYQAPRADAAKKVPVPLPQVENNPSSANKLKSDKLESNQPQSNQPQSNEPAATQLAANQPAASKPTASKPTVPKPAASKLVFSKPVSSKQVTAARSPTEVPAIANQEQPSPAPTAPDITSVTVNPKDSAIAEPSVISELTRPSSTSQSLAERSLAIASRQQQQQQVSSATLQVSQTRPELRERSNNQRLKTTPAHVAGNVLDVQEDGSFIEKIGDYCYQAKAGADLRADIFSMKPVPCGENTDEAMFERMMSEVGH